MSATLLTSRAVVRLAPRDGSEDVRDFLQGLVTNDVSGALPVYAALLSAQGKAM
ncbi:MAG: folate-binding protein, partial [Pseudomonadota bacterium]